MEKCKICGCMFDENDEGTIVNKGLANEFHICDTCRDNECNARGIVSCVDCGKYFTADVLHGEEIAGHSFTACPHCDKDVVKGLTREQFAEEHALLRYAVVVQYCHGSRGYVVSAHLGESVIKKLADKVDLQGLGVVSITYSQILLEEDEF